MQRILFLTQSSINDFSFGGAQRANHLRNALIASAAVDTVIIHGGSVLKTDDDWSPDRVRAAHLSAYGVSLSATLQRRAVKRWIAGIIAAERYDYIVAQYVDLATLVPRQARGRMIFDPDDFLKSPPPGVKVSPAERAKLWIRNRLARSTAAGAMHVWYAKSRPGHVPRNPRRSFMPNVVKVPDADRPRMTAIPRRLLMVGLFDHAPNADGIAWFMDQVWPTLAARFPDIELHAIGRFQVELARRLPAVTFRGFIDDLSAEYDRAAVVVAPIRSGGGTQIKVIDALVHERPLVASTFAHAGFAEYLEKEQHLLTAETAAEWIAACSSLLKDAPAAEAMAKRGAERASAEFGPDRMVREVKSTLASLYSEVNERPPWRAP